VAWLWTPAPEVLSVAGPPIEVEFVQAAPTRDTPRPTPAAAPRPATPKPVEQEAAPPPQPVPERAPQDAVVKPQPAPQTPQAVPDVREQERASRDAVSPKPPAPREQEERRRQEQVDLTERQRQEEAEERQRRAEQQLERLRQLAAIRTQREQAERQTRMEEQAEQQRRDLAARQPAAQPAASPSEATPTPMAGNNGVDTSLQAAYQLAIQNAVERNWRRPETIPVGQRCRIVIVQIPGGEVISADVDPTCPYDALGRDSLERAVFAASPLPYAGFEEVFVRRLGLNFQPAD